MEPIKWIGLILGVSGLILIFYLLWMIKKYHSVRPSIKIISIFVIFIVPFLALVTANYQVFETSKEVKSCMDCHVMLPMGNDMIDPKSTTLAARHFQNNWIKNQECYGCHKDYGLNGTFKAKTDGYRHLLTYITHTYEEPIQYRGEFNIENCINCHEETRTFINVEEHEQVLENIRNGTKNLNCMNCHGQAHPAPSRRTPGHPDYKILTAPFSTKGKKFTKADVSEIIQHIHNLK